METSRAALQASSRAVGELRHQGDSPANSKAKRTADASVQCRPATNRRPPPLRRATMPGCSHAHDKTQRSLFDGPIDGAMDLRSPSDRDGSGGHAVKQAPHLDQSKLPDWV